MAERNKLPRSTSLKKKADIDRLLKTGRRISGDYFSLLWEKSPDFRCGILISKRFGTAAKRNRMKRILREAVRLNRQLLTETVSIVILPLVDVGEPELDELNAEISRIFELINDRS